MANIRDKILGIQDILLCAARKWWRPLFAFTAVAILFVNGLLIPLVTWTVADLTGLSLLVTAVAAIYIARSYEITRGRAEDQVQTPPGGEQG